MGLFTGLVTLPLAPVRGGVAVAPVLLMDKQPTVWRQPVHIHMQQTTTLIAVVPQLALVLLLVAD